MIFAVGLGLNVTMFTAVRAVIGRALPVSRPEELVYVYGVGGRTLDLGEFREESQAAMSGVTSHDRQVAIAGEGGPGGRLKGDVVTSNYFDVLGVRMAMGRGLQPEDDRPGGEAAVVISHDTWIRSYASDPAVLGRGLQLDTKTYTIVGVAPEGFGGLAEPWNPAAFWTTPAHFFGPLYRGASRYLIARLRPGVSWRQVRQLGLPSKTAGVRAPVPAAYVIRAAGDVITPFEPDATGSIRVLGATAVVIMLSVMLIAATNIAGTVVARGVSRTRELAVRRALGASGWLVGRQLFLETAMLSIAGGAFGLGLSVLLFRVYERVVPTSLRADLSFDTLDFAYTATLCVVAAIIIGVVPAFQGARRIDILESLDGGHGAGVPKRTWQRWRRSVVLPQLICAVALLVVAGAHARSLAGMELSNLGYRVGDSVVITFSYLGDEDAQHSDDGQRTRSFFRTALHRVRDAAPQASVALSSMLPPMAPASPLTFAAQQGDGGAMPRTAGAARAYVSDGWFGTLDIPVLAGRDFTDTDTIASRPVAIVSRSVAWALWGSDGAVGKYLGVYAGQESTRIEWLEVVGVVGDIGPVIPDGRGRPFVYSPVEQIRLAGSYPLELVVHGRTSQGETIRIVREAIAATDSTARIWGVQSLSQILDERVYFQRLVAWTLGLASLVGVVLASLGVYGMISQFVSHQMKELAIRAALGATPNHVVAWTISGVMRLTGFAMVPSLLLAHLALRVTSAWIGGVRALDPLAFIGAPLLMAGVVLTAAYWPARRAAELNPVETLRQS